MSGGIPVNGVIDEYARRLSRSEAESVHLAVTVAELQQALLRANQLAANFEEQVTHLTAQVEQLTRERDDMRSALHRQNGG